MSEVPQNPDNKNTMNALQRLRKHWRDLPEEDKRTVRSLGVGAAIAVPIVTGVAIASSEHTDTVLDNMKDVPAPQISHDFENGPLPPEVTESPSPMNPEQSPASPNEIPSPTQRTEDVQLPTLDSPKTH